jgi:hypothetical protein
MVAVLALLQGIAATVSAAAPTLVVHADAPIAHISPFMVGAGIEQGATDRGFRGLT